MDRGAGGVKFQIPGSAGGGSASHSASSRSTNRSEKRSSSRGVGKSSTAAAQRASLPAPPMNASSTDRGKRSTASYSKNKVNMTGTDRGSPARKGPGASPPRTGRPRGNASDSQTSMGSHSRRSLSLSSTGKAAQGSEEGGKDVPLTGERGSFASATRNSLSSATLTGSGARVVTSFRGVTVPEYRGHMPRVGHTAVMYQRNVYLFGGINPKGQYVSHLYRHEKRSLQWEEVRGVGVVPSGRANHSATLVGDRMYVYGGHKNLDVFDDLFCFHMDGLRWDRIGYDKSQGPGPCFLHVAVFVPITQTIVVLGGFHQREHNMYLGHAFDVQNKVWSGIPGPAETNPQHLQLVTATFHSPRSAIVVVGIVDEEDAMARTDDPVDMPVASVYLLNIHSYAWSKVTTTSSPESPIPFRLDIVWEEFLREFVMMGGFHDEAQGSWYFPLHLTLVEKALLGREKNATRSNRNSPGLHDSTGTSASGSPGAIAGKSSAARTSQYGFFVLNLSDLTWSIMPIVFPKKLLTELAAKNRERASNQAIQTGSDLVAKGPASGWGQGSRNGSVGRHTATTSTNNSSLSGGGDAGYGSGPNVQRESRVSIVSLDTTGLDGVGTMFQQSPSQYSSGLSGGGGGSAQMNRKMLATLSQAAAGSGGGGERNTTSHARAHKAPAINALQGNFAKPDNDIVSRFRKLLLYTVQGAPQFQRKYAYAAYRDPATGGKNKAPKPLKYLIMHGGLLPDEDYTMLMFTPVLTRPEVYAMRRASSFSSAIGDEDDALDDSTYCEAGGPEDAKALHLLRKLLLDRDSEVDVASALGKRTANSQTSNSDDDDGDHGDDAHEAFETVSATGRRRARGVQSEMSQPRERGDPFARITNDTGSDVYRDISRRVHDKGAASADFAGGAMRKGVTGGDSESSEDLAGDADTVKEDCLLPTLPCTRTPSNKARFAVLYSAANSVRDPNLLPYANCPVAILEAEKDIMKWSEQHYQDTRKWLAGKMKDAVSEDKQIRRARKKRTRQTQPSSQAPSSHGGTTQNATSSAHGRADGLVESSEDDSDDDSVNGGGSRSGYPSKSAGAGGATGSTVRNTMDQVMTAMEMTATAQRAETQRRTFIKDFFEKKGLDVFNLDQLLAAQAAAHANRLGASAGQAATRLGMSGVLSSASDASGSLQMSNSPGMERLRLVTKRHEEQQRLPTSVFEQQGKGGNAEANALADLGSAMAYVLMHNALTALEADQSPEANARRARIRWRFLRALVRTGEAAFIIYRASQEASKMCAVKVTSTPGLLLAPELHLIGPTRAYKVPSRPIPYALPRPPKQTTRFAEVTPSGMVVYHNMKHVK